MAAPTAPRKNFITRDHRYVYLGGSFIALLGLGMFYSAPSPYSFIPAQSVFGTALAAICWFFLSVSAMALLVKWAYWNNYSSTIMKRPLIVRVSRYLSYLDAAACALLVLDRFILKLAYIINAAIVYLFLTYLSSLLLKAITGKMTAPDNTKRHQGNQTVDLGLPSSN